MKKYTIGRVAPVKVGEVLEVQIESIGEKGDGLARIQGFVIIVQKQGLQAGDALRIKISRLLNKFAFAEVITE